MHVGFLRYKSIGSIPAVERHIRSTDRYAHIGSLNLQCRGGKCLLRRSCHWYSKARTGVESRGREQERERLLEWRGERRISVVVNDERGVPVTVIAGKLHYYEQLAKKK